uniref:G10 protein n=1 Tax=Oryza meridionalis TaxID=40149 RepID=A0A0E0CAJ1_9ORYZ
MPKIKTSRVKYPGGWELIEPTIRELDAKMREAENDTHDGKRKCEALWPIFRISHQRSRYIYDLYYRRKEISKELYEFCLDQGYADRNLIAKWKKPGYERLCCLRCIQTRDHNFATTCVCRVPKHLREEKVAFSLAWAVGAPCARGRDYDARCVRVMSAFAVFDAYRHETTTLQLHVSAGSPSISERRSHTAGM